MQVISRLLICNFQHLQKVYYIAFEDFEHYLVSSVAIFLLITVLNLRFLFEVIFELILKPEIL